MKLLRAVRAIPMAAVLFAAAAGPLGAQTWHWQIVFHPAGGGTINAVSEVDLSAHDVRLSYFTTIQNRRVPIASCSAALSDISTVQTVPNGGRTFLALRMKPGHAAACDTGPQSVAILPVSDDALAPRVAAEINGACCSVASLAAPRRAAATTPVPTPAPIRSAPKPVFVLTDVVENDGVFYFVRVRNRFADDVTITDGAITNCRGVVYGCGPLNGHELILKRGAIVTIATVMSSSSPRDPAFSYRYTAQSGDGLFEGAGDSAKRAKVWFPKLTAAEIRAAENAAVVALRSLPAVNGQSPAPPAASAAIVATPPPAHVGVRLVRRGESRLAIGKTGTAAVRVTVNSAGLPVSATVVSVSNQLLAPAAIETAISSTYAPAMRNGVNVAGSYDAKFRFDGSDPSVASIPSWRRAPASAPSPAPSPT